MTKNKIRWWIVFAVAMVAYHVVAFAIPFPKNAVFFMSWLFTVIAICAQIYTVRTAFYQGESVRSKFYGFPIAKIGAIYLTVQLILGLCFMAVGFVAVIPIWIPFVLYVLLLGAAAVGFISADAVRDEIERQDEKLKKDVRNMRMLQTKAVSMVQLAHDGQMRKLLEKFAEDLRFSDPVSSEATEELEASLTVCVDELRQTVIKDDKESASMMLQKAEEMLMERNILCKMEKK